MLKRAIKVFICAGLFTLTTILPNPVFAQKAGAKPPKAAAGATPKPKTAVSVKNEQTEFSQAETLENSAERITALQAFIAKFPNSTRRNQAAELIAVSRAEIAAEKLKNGATAEAVELLRLVVSQSPLPYSDKLHDNIIGKIPLNLLFFNERNAAIEFARVIEEKVGDNAPRLLGLVNFYLAVEDSENALRLAKKAVAIEPNSAKGQEVLGLAYRVGFQLEEAEQAFGRAVELDSNSINAKRSLADLKRALGENDESINLYRYLLTQDENNAQARTGLILALFGANKRGEAESEMAKTLEKNPGNLNLMVGAAYWYVSNGESLRGIELAQKAIALEPRFVWAQIALARGLIAQKRPLEAEKVLLIAKQYANFPTLEYELANARFHAGFYEEAAQDLQKVFRLNEGKIETNLGGRVPKGADNFIALLEPERRASIFQYLAADTPENAQALKNLLAFRTSLELTAPNEEELLNLAKNFAAGKDESQTLRQLYVANNLLAKKVALPQVLELTQAATNGVSATLEMASASSGVMADELYEPRRLANVRGEVLNVPDVPKVTLDKILRGRIEEIAGWTLFNQNKPAEAVVRLRRAVSVLPENSAWWRSSYWKLGFALDANGKSADALEAYLKSYKSGEPDITKRTVIEAVYRRVNGSLDGLDAKIGVAPKAAEPIAKIAETRFTATVTPTATPTETPQSSPTPETQPTQTPQPETAATPQPKETPETKPEPTPEVKTITPNEPKTEPSPDTPAENANAAKPEPTAAPEVKTEDSAAGKKPANSDETATATVPVQTLKIEETPETTEKKNDLPTAEPKAELQPASNGQPASENSGNSAEIIEKNIEIRPRIVHIETEKERKRREKEERELRRKEEKRRSKAEDNPPVKSAEQNTDLRENTRNKVVAPSAKVQNSEPKTDAAPENSSFKTLPVTPNLVAENNNAVNPAPTSAPKSENPTIIDTTCNLRVLQSEVLISGNGGLATIAVDLEGLARPEDLKAKSSDEDDLTIETNGDVGRTARGLRLLFLVKSKTSESGIYTVTFSSPCGKKQVLVKVQKTQ